MAFTPFMQGTSAQSIINNYLDSGGFNQTIANDSIRNPIFDLRTEQGLSADALYPNPLIDFSVTEDEVVDPCPEGYQLIDGVCQPMEQFGQSLYQPDNQGDNDYSDTRTESQKMYDEMKKDTSNPFGAKNIIEKYQIGEDDDGNPIYDFDEKKGRPFGLFGIADMLLGGGKSREEKYNQAVKTLIDQTQSKFFEDNPLAFGKQSGDLFTMYSPQNYLNQVKDVMIADGINQATVGTMLDSVGNAKQDVNITDTGGNVVYQTPTRQVNSGQQGTEVSRNLGSLLQDDGKRDNTSYQAAIAKNIARNLSGSPHSTGSGFSTSLGGFYKGR